jgi:hypothetical protein
MKKDWLEKYQIFIYLLIVIVGLVGLKIKYGYEGEDNLPAKISESTPSPIPSVTTVPTKTEETEYPLFKKLPYYGKGYIIEKYVAPLTLKMILNGATEKSATNDVKVWLRSQGKAGDNHKIELEIDH